MGSIGVVFGGVVSDKFVAKMGIRSRVAVLAISQVRYYLGSYFKLLNIGSSPGDVGAVPVMKVKQQKGWRMSCDIGEAMEGLENEP